MAIKRALARAELKSVDIEHFACCEPLIAAGHGAWCLRWLIGHPVGRTSKRPLSRCHRTTAVAQRVRDEAPRSGTLDRLTESGVLRVRYRDDPSTLPGKSELPGALAASLLYRLSARGRARDSGGVMAFQDIPRSVLSEHFEEGLSAVVFSGLLFLTFEFDPGFFEHEILPVMLDTPVSHAEVPGLLQLEAALRELPYGVTVIYDWSGLQTATTSPPALMFVVFRRASGPASSTPRTFFSDRGSRTIRVGDVRPATTGRLDVGQPEDAHRLVGDSRRAMWRNSKTGEATGLRDPLRSSCNSAGSRTDSPDVEAALLPFQAVRH